MYDSRHAVDLIRVFFDYTISDNGPDGAPNYLRTVSSTTTVASGKRALCMILNYLFMWFPDSSTELIHFSLVL